MPKPTVGGEIAAASGEAAEEEPGLDVLMLDVVNDLLEEPMKGVKPIDKETLPKKVTDILEVFGAKLQRSFRRGVIVTELALREQTWVDFARDTQMHPEEEHVNLGSVIQFAQRRLLEQLYPDHDIKLSRILRGEDEIRKEEVREIQRDIEGHGEKSAVFAHGMSWGVVVWRIVPRTE